QKIFSRKGRGVLHRASRDARAEFTLLYRGLVRCRRIVQTSGKKRPIPPIPTASSLALIWRLGLLFEGFSGEPVKFARHLLRVSSSSSRSSSLSESGNRTL